MNLEHPKVATEEDLLTSQVHHLRECFDRYMQQKTLSSAEKSSKPFLQTRCGPMYTCTSLYFVLTGVKVGCCLCLDSATNTSLTIRQTLLNTCIYNFLINTIIILIFGNNSMCYVKESSELVSDSRSGVQMRR